MPTNSNPPPPNQPDTILLNKASVIERALKRMKEEYQADPQLTNYTHIDAMVLNIERACQAAIDAAQHLVAEKRLGIPQTSAETFRLLEQEGLLTTATAQAMAGMTGFRNIAIHQYQSLNQDILHAIASRDHQTLITFANELGLRIEP